MGMACGSGFLALFLWTDKKTAWHGGGYCLAPPGEDYLFGFGAGLGLASLSSRGKGLGGGTVCSLLERQACPLISFLAALKKKIFALASPSFKNRNRQAAFFPV